MFDTTTVEYIIVGIGLVIAGIVMYKNSMYKPVDILRDKWGYCPKCGENKMGPNFCRTCGTKLAEKHKIKGGCKVCGKNPGKMRYCMHCGAVHFRVELSRKNKCDYCGAKVRGHKVCPSCGASIIEKKPRKYNRFVPHKRIFMIDKDFYDEYKDK